MVKNRQNSSMERLRLENLHSVSVENVHAVSLVSVRHSVSVENLHKYVLPNEDYVEKNGHIGRQNRQQEEERMLAKAATFVFIFFQLCYLYFVDIVKRAIYLTNLQHSADEGIIDESQRVAKKIIKDSNKALVSRRVPLEQFPVTKRDISAIGQIQKQIRVDRKPFETNYITTVFEVHNGGLKSLIDDISDEIRRWQTNVIEEFIVCCEVVWSVPTKYRNYPSEIRLKNEISNTLRSNNQRISDSEMFGTGDLLNRSSVGCITEETAGRKNGCYVGVYRRYYQELLDLAHQETKMTHEPEWKFNPDTLEPIIEWPVIGSLKDTAVVMLNVICVKF